MLRHSPFACSSNGFGKPKQPNYLEQQEQQMQGILSYQEQSELTDPCCSGDTASLSLFYPHPKSI